MKPRAIFRKGVCGIFISENGKVLLGERSKEKGHWQLPQGGIEGNESPIEALYREMQEETGLVDIKVVRDSGVFISYRWPADVFPDSELAGQEHVYFLIDVAHLNIETLAATEEFSGFDWFTIEEALSEVVEWKRPAYQQAFQVLGLLR